MNSIRVSQLLEDREYDLRLTLVAGERGVQHRINSSRIQKPGLALTGFTEHLHPHRVQVFGNTEVSYLLTLPEARQREVLDSLFQEELACVVVTKDIPPPSALLEACEKAGLALMRTPLLSSQFIQQVQAFLEEALTEASSLHGVLMDVFGVGIL
ncbi:MAG TPA: HPr kinase/phosphorylase, partial [Archangium sp.]|nr:HPr kinase/phosphorylase [Archangium sp.]